MKASQTRIAIAGSFGYMDIGDEAMLTEDLWFLRNQLGISSDHLYLFGDNPQYVSEYHGHPLHACYSSRKIESNWKVATQTGLPRLKRLLASALRLHRTSAFDSSIHNVLSSCQAALITGGGTINTRDDEGWSVRRMHAIVSYFRHCGLRVFMSGQTIGPLGINSDHDRLAAEIIRNTDVLTVRDTGHSRRFLDAIGVRPKQFLETFDDAYTLPYRTERLPKDCAAFLSRGSTAAVNVTEYTASQESQRAYVAKLCERLIAEDGKQLVLVSHTPGDFRNLSMIRDLIEGAFHSRIFVPDTTLWNGSMLKKLIASCGVAIGGRYHFIVFAGTSDTPFVGMCGNNYSYIKQDGFARAVGLQDFILSEHDTWDSERLWTRYLEAKKLKLNLEMRFQRPSESMRLFGQWLESLQ